MGSPFEDIPVIDFSKADLKPGSEGWNTLKSQVQKALEETGCFKGLFYKISPELHKATFDAVEELFDLPLETKLLNYSPKSSHGYNGQLPTVPLYESLGFENADIFEEAEKLTNILWPNGNPNFRANRYEEPKNTDKNIGMTPHKDSNSVTILFQNNIDGLEMQTKDGDWIDVKVSPNSFIVMIGESLYAWTNGRLHNPSHRVMMTGNNARYSVGLFSIFKAGYMVKTPPELVDEEEALLYKPFDYGEYLEFRARQSRENKTVDKSLKAYCGV